MDLDGDGYPDVLSGSFPGELFLFRGQADHTFAAPEMLKDKKGEIINIGGGITEDADGTTLIRGSAEWENVDGKSFVKYRGKRLESTAERPLATTGTASTVCAADWDGDGDIDLIVGDFNGSVYLVRNEGTPQSCAFAKEERLVAGGHTIQVSSGQAGPCVADWDGDGALDLLVGAENGSVSLYRNIGTRTAPKLAVPVQLVVPVEVRSRDQVPKEVHRGNRSKICVADWNGDGKPDLLVGDRTDQKPDRPEPTAEEQARYDRIRKELEPLQKRAGELISQMMGPSRVRDAEQQKKLNEEFQQLQKQMQPLRAQLPRESETHGWVWLFLRK
jgi:hypothetical protein